jgi:hypothetical protein
MMADSRIWFALSIGSGVVHPEKRTQLNPASCAEASFRVCYNPLFCN